MTESILLQLVDEGFPGVLVLPRSRSGPGLLLVHAWWGLNDFFRNLATRFAEAGFVTLAPDYYKGQVADTVEVAKALRGTMDRKSTEKLLRVTVEYLKAHSAVSGKSIGVIGFSLGARFSLSLARAKAKDVGAVVVFYGVAGGVFREFKIPVQGHFAENDEWGAGPKAVQKLRDRLAAGESEIDFHTYPGTTHWFFEENVTEAYHAEAASLAFNRAVQFFREKLGQ